MWSQVVFNTKNEHTIIIHCSIQSSVRWTLSDWLSDPTHNRIYFPRQCNRVQTAANGDRRRIVVVVFFCCISVYVDATSNMHERILSIELAEWILSASCFVEINLYRIANYVRFTVICENTYRVCTERMYISYRVSVGVCVCVAAA